MKQAFEGIYCNGTVRLTEDVPFFGEQEVLVVFTEGVPKNEPKPTIEELEAFFDGASIDTRGWKFDREEANGR